jgi:hypothetical protein
MSELSTILSNEIWYEIVGFYPLENVVSSVQYAAENVIEVFKKDRFVKLKKWRNHLLNELLILWRHSCACQERRMQAPKGSAILEQINVEFAATRENVRQKLRQLFKILNLPWIYQKCGVGVSDNRMSLVKMFVDEKNEFRWCA